MPESSTTGVDYVIRDARPEDEGFVASGYVATVRMATPRQQLKRMPDGAFSAYHFAFIGRLMKSARTRVASSRDDDTVLYGFSVISAQQVHCVYVSKSHWRSGMGRALLGGISLSEAIFRLWPQTGHGSDTEWLWPRVEKLKYLPYWLEVPNGRTEK